MIDFRLQLLVKKRGDQSVGNKDQTLLAAVRQLIGTVWV